MALTASAQSALPFSWDETIVPALRKRKFFKSYVAIRPDNTNLGGRVLRLRGQVLRFNTLFVSITVSNANLLHFAVTVVEILIGSLLRFYHFQVSKVRVACSQSACLPRR
jgi:hypothetical protein